MVTIKISSIPIHFPYTPYSSQIIIISKILSSLNSNISGMIESPTGTGKTLAILTSILAYLEHTKTNLKVYIITRTHKQISQFISQLNSTVYKNFSICILSSRLQTCINSVANKSENIERTCAELLKKNNCAYFHKREILANKICNEILDIENIKKMGKMCGGCPYYATKIVQERANIVFCPYNYIVDEGIRKSMDINLKDAVVIVDEAHNVEDFCRSAGTVEVHSTILDVVAMEMVKKVRNGFLEENVKNDMFHVLEMLRKFKKIGENKEKNLYSDFKKIGENKEKNLYSDGKPEYKTGLDIVSIFTAQNITKEDILKFKAIINGLSNNEVTRDMLALATQHILRSLCFVLEVIFFKNPDYYAFYLKKGNSDFTLCFWLLDPALIFLPLTNLAKSIILLSGTLSPFTTFESELDYKFNYTLQAPHVIDKKNVYISVIQSGHLNKDLVGTYNNTENLVYLEQIVNIITEVRAKVLKKGGTLVFVPSYNFLEILAKRMQKVKNVHFEPRNSTTIFSKIFKAFQNDIALHKGPIFVCVFRGRSSEGIDFKDSYCRAVIAIGVPYPANSNEVKAKREYNDKNKSLKGSNWYEAQAFRAVNQAVGRVIRHKNDWGGVFLVDKRYSNKRVMDMMSMWVKDNVSCKGTSNECLEMWKEFLKNKDKAIGTDMSEKS